MEATPADLLVIRMATMKAALDALDQEVSNGTTLHEALGHFRAALDRNRIGTGALLTSRLSRVMAHWRLKRVIDFCCQVAGDAQGGRLGEDPADLRRVYAALGQARIEIARHLGSGAEAETRAHPAGG